MDNNIQNKFIMNMLNVDDKDIESLDCVDDSNGNLTPDFRTSFSII